MVVLRPDEVLSKHGSLSMATKTMFCEREKVEVLNAFLHLMLAVHILMATSFFNVCKEMTHVLY